MIDQQTLDDRGLRTTSEAVQAATGVTASDAPGAPADSFHAWLCRRSDQHALQRHQGRSVNHDRPPHGLGNLEQIEILKGPASLLSGEGATGGTINYVNKKPHTGKIENEAFTAYDSISGFRSGFGSGGSSAIKGLDYRFDVVGTQGKSFIDDTYSKLLNISGQLDYRVTNNFKIWGAVERKQDKDRFYWGTPLVPANAPGIVPTKGIVSGLWTQYYPADLPHRRAQSGHGRCPDAANHLQRARQPQRGAGVWLRGGFDWDIVRDVKLRSQVYHFKPSATGSTTRSTRSTIVPRPLWEIRARSSANGFPWTTIRG